MKNSAETGTYIVIEGNDGTGKTTQVQLLADKLAAAGHETVMIEEPGSEKLERSTPVANYLRSVIKNGTLQHDPEIDLALFSAARRELIQNRITPALARDAIVLSSRNYFSTLAYQGRGDGISEEHILEITRLFTDQRYMKPDLMLILTLGDEAARTLSINNRGPLDTLDTFESRDSEYQARVNQGYVDLARDHAIETIERIEDGHNKSVEEIHQEICNHPLIAELLDRP